jgi:DNA-binding transcriptional MerR regulator
VLIGELAAVSGTTAKTIRFYEANALLPPAARTAGGYRDFTPKSIARLDFIRRGRAASLTLAQIREILRIRDAGDAPCQHVRGLLAERLAVLDAQIAALQDLRDTVSQLHDGVAAGPDRSDAVRVCCFL